jgi:hypothetical protein
MNSSSAPAILSKGMCFLHYVEPELIEHMCKNYDVVKVSIEAYNYEEIIHPDGTDKPPRKMELSQTWGTSYQIRSLKDLIQFDDSDMKILSKQTKRELR